MQNEKILELFETLKKVSREGFEAGDILIEMLTRSADTIDSLNQTLGEQFQENTTLRNAIAVDKESIAALSSELVAARSEAAKYAEAYNSLIVAYETDQEKLAAAAAALEAARANVSALSDSIAKAQAEAQAARDNAAAISAEFTTFQNETSINNEKLMGELRAFISETQQEQSDVGEVAASGSQAV